MSDDDDFMQDSDQEEYDFEYEDADDDDSGDIGIENKYYNAKQIKVDNPEEAIDEFLGAVTHYQELLTYVKSAVTRNYSEKSINNMLDFIEKSSDDEKAYHCMEKFYSLTLNSFQNTNNERLWLKTNIKLAKLWLDREQYAQLSKKLRELHKACQKSDGTDDPAKGTYSLEVYALEIQMYANTKNNKRLKALYQRALKVRSAVPHPKIMGIIRECGGKMHMSEENWKEAHSDFFESFRNYDEAGSMQRIQVLKYMVLATMLMKSDINPFDSQETKPYKDDPRVSGMTDLVDAFQRDDIHTYEAILRDKQDLMNDPFIAENIDEVSRTMRTKAVMKLIQPYTRFSLAFVSKKLKISIPEVQDILSYLILDKELLDAKINEEVGIVEITRMGAVNAARVKALATWRNELDSMWNATFTHADGFKVDDSRMHPLMGGFSGMGMGYGPYEALNMGGMGGRGQMHTKVMKGRPGRPAWGKYSGN
ncbi:COP9 signalosome complex subunit 2 [Arthroderma uncinatum]|uniref:COP9 signalosome complex subunit 2 n=1 Tax=Arthroderma uncinatum TaxID=74035 RepID=UPI00144AA879|nr:COP9 signalosome complex subunit 2 [Arthroderma uncinatum]KAF3482364.1 COP9 signalosome complex subunit 2 [Arthroderma uncinatum]